MKCRQAIKLRGGQHSRKCQQPYNKGILFPNSNTILGHTMTWAAWAIFHNSQEFWAMFPAELGVLSWERCWSGVESIPLLFFPHTALFSHYCFETWLFRTWTFDLLFLLHIFLHVFRYKSLALFKVIQLYILIPVMLWFHTFFKF